MAKFIGEFYYGNLDPQTQNQNLISTLQRLERGEY